MNRQMGSSVYYPTADPVPPVDHEKTQTACVKSSQFEKSGVSHIRHAGCAYMADPHHRDYGATAIPEAAGCSRVNRHRWIIDKGEVMKDGHHRRTGVLANAHRPYPQPHREAPRSGGHTVSPASTDSLQESPAIIPLRAKPALEICDGHRRVTHRAGGNIMVTAIRSSGLKRGNVHQNEQSLNR